MPTNLREALVDEIRDLFSAEKQILKALPKMIKGANSEELRDAFESHLEETHGQVARLERVFTTTPRLETFRSSAAAL